MTKNNKPIIKTFHSSVLPGKRLYNAYHHTECELSLFVSGSGIYSVKEIQFMTLKKNFPKKQGYKTETKHKLFSALIHIMREYDYIEKNNILFQKIAIIQSLEDAMEYIHAHLYEQLTIT